jgi:hypothetical protein
MGLVGLPLGNTEPQISADDHLSKELGCQI